MDNNNRSSIDPVDLLHEHYEAVEMPGELRRSLQSSTRGVVAKRRRESIIRWAVGLAGTTAVAVLLMVMVFHGSSEPESGTVPRHERSADAGKTVQPLKKDLYTPKQKGGVMSPTAEKGKAPERSNLEPRGLAPNQRDMAKQQTPTQDRVKHIADGPVVSDEPIVAVVSLQQPVVDGSGRALTAGDRLPAGAAVRTGKGGRVTLVTGKGSELALDANSELTLTSKSTATITRGRLYCTNRNKEIANIDTPAGQVKLLGTILDTAVVGKDSVAVTVVEGKVQLANRHGKALVDAGKQSVLSAFRAPQSGKAVNTCKETSWYQGRGEYQSDFGDIAYIVPRGDGLISEVWTMKLDGSGRHRVKSYLGNVMESGQWLPGEQWLALQTHSLLWTTPDIEKRRAHAGGGHPIVDTRTWLLNAATGQEIRFHLPDAYRSLYMSFSPNAKLMAFCGSYNPDPGNWDKAEGGVWVYDNATGEISKVFDGWIMTPVAWAPDNRLLAVSSGEEYTNEHSLMIVDTQTREIKDLGVKGAGATFSPDGSRLAYCGEFKKSGSWFNGVPTSGSVFTLDLAGNKEPVRVSPPEDDAVMPRWSPDGSRVAYVVSLERVCIVNADGSELRTAYKSESGKVWKVSWAPNGDAVYVTVRERSGECKTVLIAADGSGIIKILSQLGEDSGLPARVQKQTDAAVSDITEAVFQYAMGNIHTFEGDLGARRKSFTDVAGIFSKLVWNHPLSGLSAEDVFAYADAASSQAVRSDSELLHECCEDRANWLGRLIAVVAAEHKQLPQDLPTLMSKLTSMSWTTNWLENSDRKHVMMLGLCPGGVGNAATPFVYTPPADGAEPKVGDVLITCPQHRDVCYTWSEHDARQLNIPVMRDGEPGAFCKLWYSSKAPYRFENVGDGPLTVTRHVMRDTYEIQGKARLLPTGKVYSDECVSLGPLDECSVAKSIDEAGFVDWGNLPVDEAARAQEELEFCRCVAKYEAGLGVEDCKLLTTNPDYTVLDGEPARRLYNGPAEGFWSAPTLRFYPICFEPMGSGNIQLYQLEPSGRFRVYGTVRVLHTDETCTNGWIDKDGKVISTEK